MTGAELPDDLAAQLAADDDEMLRSAVGPIFDKLEARPYASRRTICDEVARRLLGLPLSPNSERSDAGADGGGS